MTYHSMGKQVLHGRTHVADACDNGTATMIAEALNRTADIDRHPDMFSDRPTAMPEHHVERQTDEYACSCGARWDASEGEKHP